jgi:uncharacterized protein YcaQ
MFLHTRTLVDLTRPLLKRRYHVMEADPMPYPDLSLSEARRLGLAAQGFDRPRPSGRVGRRDLRRTIRQLGLLQIDYVNVLIPAQYQVPYARLGPYDRSHLDDLIYRQREFTEQWAHEASIVPVETWPLLRHRMEAHRVRHYGFESFLAQNAEYASWILDEVHTRGPLAADDMPERDGIPLRLAGAWQSSVPRAVLEFHFARGILAVAERRSDFARTFDLTERLISSDHHSREIGREEAQRELLRLAARAYGIGTADDLADYYRMPVRDARPRLAELVESGELSVVKVESWRQPAYLHRDARLPKQIEAASLLSPFDPLIWYRKRVARLFEFDYRVEIFVPKPKRRWGYYVLPFLLGDRLVARVDLKADRKEGRLLVLAAHLEPHAQAGPVASALAVELLTMAKWLGLSTVVVAKHGELARALAAAVRSRA